MTSSYSPTRRDAIRLLAALTAGSQSGWLQSLAAATAAAPQRHKSVILLWLDGGPATIDLWDLKPGHENGGPFKEIETTVSGIRISEHLPKVARQMKHLAIVRSMATREGDHGRARQVGLTGYAPQGAIQFPAFGSLVAHEFDNKNTDLPGFVSINSRQNSTFGGGFLGPRYSPLVVGDNNRRLQDGPGNERLNVPNLERAEGVGATTQVKRLELLAELEQGFDAGRGTSVAEAMKSATDRAVRLMRPEAASAFNLEDEKTGLRDAYGRNSFGQGCLLARRLVERGVPFIEVTLGGWDTHANNFTSIQRLAGTLDAAFATLLADLKERGLLDSTLVVCEGEFGRTPKINGNTGRDHWPASWSAVLAGGRIKSGQVIGKTSADGMEVIEKATRTPDLLATICRAISIDPQKQNLSNVNRPIRIADPGAQPIEELL